MSLENLVGRCGLYCGACTIYRAYKDRGKLLENVAKYNNCHPEEIHCQGCQTALRDGWSFENEWGANCSYLKCLEARGLEFCYQCPEYSQCQKFDELARSALMHGEDIRENLERIKAGDTKNWLAEQDRKWRCPSCGNPVPIRIKECHWCGGKINQNYPG